MRFNIIKKKERVQKHFNSFNRGTSADNCIIVPNYSPSLPEEDYTAPPTACDLWRLLWQE